MANSKRLGEDFGADRDDARPDPGEKSRENKPARETAEIAGEADKNAFPAGQRIAFDFHIDEKLETNPDDCRPNNPETKARN